MIIYMETLRDTLSKNFKRVIEDSGMTVRELAHRIGVSETSLHRWKSGAEVPKLEHVDGIARVLNIDPGEFYKSERPIINISPRGTLKKYLVIPDQVVELASQLGDDQGYVWDEIIETLEIALKQKEVPSNGKG